MGCVKAVVLPLGMLLAGAVSPAAAQTESLDIATFTPPGGWRVERRQNLITYTHTDEAARNYCMLGLYASTRTSGNPANDFAAEWEALVRRTFTAGAAPRPAPGRTPGGLSYLEGAAGVIARQTGSAYLLLTVLAAGDRSMSVLTVCTDRAALATRQAAIQSFFASLRIGSGPASGAPPPAGTPSSSRVIYQAPAGWSRSESGGSVTLVRTVDLGFNVKQDFRLVIMPPERVSGAALQTFHSLWSRLVGSIFSDPIRPLPLRVRLAGGATLLYDGENMRVKQNNATVDGFLYAVVDGDTVVPVIGFFVGWDEALDRALRQFFDSFRLPGGGGRSQPLFEAREIAGVWRYSSSTLANWVDVYGNYRGDASISVGETMTIRADGTYESQFAAIGGSVGRMRQHDVGRFTIEDDFLVLRPNAAGQQPSRFRITGVGASSEGRGSFLLLGMTRSDFPFLSAGSRRSRAGDLYVSAR